MAEDELTIKAAIRDELSGPLEAIRHEIRGTADDIQRASGTANGGARSFDRMASGAGRFVKAGIGMAAKAAAVGLTVLTAAAVAGSIKVLSLASDAAETASAFNTVFKGVSGNVAGYIRRMNKEFGITTQELQTAANTFGVFGKAAGVSKGELGGFTKDLVSAGLDLSSFYNTDPGETFAALRSGLAGEAEPLRQYGIFLSDASMKAQAAQMGLTGTLTESQKVMVRQAIILKSLGDAEGDLARTKDGLANKTRALKGRLTEAATVIGTALIPYANKAAVALDNKLGPAVARLPKQLDRAEATVKSYVSAWQAGGMDSVVSKLDDQAGAGGKLEAVWAKVSSVAGDLGTIVSDILYPAFTDVSGALPAVLSPLKLVDDVLGFMADHASTLAPLVTALVAAYVAYSIAGKAVAVTMAVVGVIQKVHAAGLVAETAATGATATAQWSLNAALMANPIGLVIIAIAALVGGFILAYKKVGWFRDAVNFLWNNILKPFGSFLIGVFVGYWKIVGKIITWLWDTILKPVGSFIGKVLVAYLKTLASGFLTMASFAVKAFAFLAKAAFKAFDMILSAAEKGLGWIPKFGPKIAAARAAFDKFGDGVVADLNRTAAKLDQWNNKLNTVTKDRTVRIDVVTYYTKRGAVSSAGGHEAPDPALAGDTASTRARGAGGLAATLATHARTAAATGARPTITNALTGGGGYGAGSGDHQAGRALDLTGQGLARYGAHIRAEGGYAAFHGAGAGRHLHAVPAGDTVTPRRRARPSSSAGDVTIAAGAIVVKVDNPASNVDVAEAVKQGIEEWLRDRDERG